LRIAFLVSEFPALTEMGVLNQVTGLLDAGHDVTVFSRARASSEVTQPEVARYGLLERTRYFDIPVEKPRRVARGAFIAVKNLPRDPGTVLESVNVFKYGVPALSLTLLFAALSPPRGPFDIVHCHFGPNGIIGSFLRDRGMPGKLLASFHGHDASEYPRLAGANAYRRLFANADALTANTEFLKARLVTLGCDPRKVSILPSSVRLERFEFRERKQRDSRPVRILTVGRLVEKKGHEFAIRSLARVVPDYRNIEYLIAGEGPLRGRLERLVAELGLQGQVRFLGAASQDRIQELYYDSDIFLLPSVTTRKQDHEGQALTVQEAQASGMPVITTLHNGIPEGVLEGESAFLVPERDTVALADRLAYLLEHPEEWARMGRAGHDFVRSTYGVPALTERLVKIYEGLLKGERP
jgi:colanic acid/amylovoran biosynthesis glycosyltransferase